MALGFNIYPGNLELFALTQVASWSTTNRTAQREELVDFLFSGAGWAVNCSWNCLNIQGCFGTVRASDGKGPSGGECVDKHATAMADLEAYSSDRAVGSGRGDCRYNIAKQGKFMHNY